MYQRIRDLREDADLSQRQLAEILHMHKTTYARYESGEREIPLNIAILLAKYYRVSLDYLAGGHPAPTEFYRSHSQLAAFSPGFFPPCALTATVLQ